MTPLRTIDGNVFQQQQTRQQPPIQPKPYLFHPYNRLIPNTNTQKGKQPFSTTPPGCFSSSGPAAQPAPLSLQRTASVNQLSAPSPKTLPVVPPPTGSYRSKRPPPLSLHIINEANTGLNAHSHPQAYCHSHPYPSPALTSASTCSTFSRPSMKGNLSSRSSIFALDSPSPFTTSPAISSAAIPTSTSKGASALSVRGWTPFGASSSSEDLVQSPDDLRKEIHGLVASCALTMGNPDQLDFLLSSLTSPCPRRPATGSSVADSGGTIVTAEQTKPHDQDHSRTHWATPVDPFADTPTRPSLAKTRTLSHDPVHGRQTIPSLKQWMSSQSTMKPSPTQAIAGIYHGSDDHIESHSLPTGVSYFASPSRAVPIDASPPTPIRLAYVHRFEDPLPIPDYDDLDAEAHLDMGMSAAYGAGVDTEMAEMGELRDFTPRKPTFDVMM